MFRHARHLSAGERVFGNLLHGIKQAPLFNIGSHTAIKFKYPIEGCSRNAKLSQNSGCRQLWRGQVCLDK